MCRTIRSGLLLSLNGKKYLCTDAALMLLAWIFSEVVEEINEWSDAKKPSRSFASICVTLASSMIASALKDDLYPKPGKRLKLMGYSTTHKKLQKVIKLLSQYSVSSVVSG